MLVVYLASLTWYQRSYQIKWRTAFPVTGRRANGNDVILRFSHAALVRLINWNFSYIYLSKIIQTCGFGCIFSIRQQKMNGFWGLSKPGKQSGKSWTTRHFSGDKCVVRRKNHENWLNCSRWAPDWEQFQEKKPSHHISQPLLIWSISNLGQRTPHRYQLWRSDVD